METLLALILTFTTGLGITEPVDKTSSTAEIVWVKGSVLVETANDEKGVATPGGLLVPGEAVMLDEDESMTLLTSDYFLITLNGPGVIDITSLIESDLSANYPRLDRVRMRAVAGSWPNLSIHHTTKTPSAPLIIQSPRATAITDPRPWIIWKSMTQMAGINLRLEILLSNGTFETVEVWNNVRTQAFQFSQSLRTGRFYRIVGKSETMRDTTSIYVLSEDELKAVNKAEKNLEQSFNALKISPSIRRIIKARWLDDHGLADRATEQWIELEMLFPNISSFKSESKWHQARTLATPNGLLSLRGTAEWLIELAPLFLPTR